MATSTNFDEMRCSIARSYAVIGDPWKALVIRDLHLRLSRFDQLVDDLGISRKVLTQRLNAMIDDGIVERVTYQQHPPRHDYELTAAGNALVPIVLAMLAWGDQWRADEHGPPSIPLHHDHPCDPQVICGTCGEAIEASDVTAAIGPGGIVGPGTRMIGTKMSTLSS